MIHDGITPKPIEVILTAQTLSCRLKEAYEKKESHDSSHRGNYSSYQNIGGRWDLIVKVVGARRKRPRRTAFAYEATELQGIVIFFLGTASSGASIANAATQEALVEVVVKAKGLGFCRILFICSSRRLA